MTASAAMARILMIADRNSGASKAFTKGRFSTSSKRTVASAGTHDRRLGHQKVTEPVIATMSATPVTIQQDQQGQPTIKPAQGPGRSAERSAKDLQCSLKQQELAPRPHHEVKKDPMIM